MGFQSSSMTVPNESINDDFLWPNSHLLDHNITLNTFHLTITSKLFRPPLISAATVLCILKTTSGQNKMVANGNGPEMATGGARELQTKAVPSESIRVTGLTAKPPGPNMLCTNEDKVYGDWRDDLIRDGYVVIKGAIPADRAAKYQDDMLSYLETL